MGDRFNADRVPAALVSGVASFAALESERLRLASASLFGYDTDGVLLPRDRAIKDVSYSAKLRPDYSIRFS